MRKLVALAIAFFLVFQSTAMLAAPVEPCCLDDCTAKACVVLVCPACDGPVAAGPREVPGVRLQVFFAHSGDEAAADSAPQAIWRPPD